MRNKVLEYLLYTTLTMILVLCFIVVFMGVSKAEETRIIGGDVYYESEPMVIVHVDGSKEIIKQWTRGVSEPLGDGCNTISYTIICTENENDYSCYQTGGMATLIACPPKFTIPKVEGSP